MSKAPKKAKRTRKRPATARVSKSATPPDVAAAAAPDAPVTEEFRGPDRIHDFASSLTQSSVESTEPVAQKRLETWVSFQLAGETFAFPVTGVKEILRVPTITRVPHAPYTVRGIINVRGRVTPVVDVRLRLGLTDNPISPQSRILITSVRGHSLGLLVDSVEQVVRVDLNQMQPPPSDAMTDQSDYIIGVYHSDHAMLILLDLEQVLVIPDSLQDVAT